MKFTFAAYTILGLLYVTSAGPIGRSHSNDGLLGSPRTYNQNVKRGVVQSVFDIIKLLVEEVTARVAGDCWDESLNALVASTFAKPTKNEWEVLGHGYIFQRIRQETTCAKVFDELIKAGLLLTGRQPENLSDEDWKRARETAADLLVRGKSGIRLSVDIGASNTSQKLTLAAPSGNHGDFDEFIRLKPSINTRKPSAGGKPQEQALMIDQQDTNVQQVQASSAHMIPPEGLTILSDIDDILRVVRTWNIRDSIFHTLAEEYVPWSNMPDIYALWQQNNPGAHFHYISMSPELLYRRYSEFLWKYYPRGSFVQRPLSQLEGEVRYELNKIVIESFPQRKFVLVSDTSSQDALDAFPKLALEFPNQVSCIIIRNDSFTAPDFDQTVDLQALSQVPRSKVAFIGVPDDLRQVDLNQFGDCNVEKTSEHGLIDWGATGNGGGLDEVKEVAEALLKMVGDVFD